MTDLRTLNRGWYTQFHLLTPFNFGKHLKRISCLMFLITLHCLLTKIRFINIFQY